MFVFAEIRYQLCRNRSRTLLTVCVAFLLVSCMAFYLGNIQMGEAALKNLAQAVPVTVQVVSANGFHTVGLEIDQDRFQAMMEAEIRDPVYTASAYGVYQQDRREGEFRGPDTTITATNSLASMAGLVEEEIGFVKGGDSSCLEGVDAVCLLSEAYAQQWGLQLGEAVSLPIYVSRYNEDGFSTRFEALGEQQAKVIGIYPSHLEAGAVPTDMLVPIGWLKSVVEEKGLSFLYDSFQGALANPLELNGFKELAKKKYFRQVNVNARDSYEGNALVVNDQIFVETAEKLEQNGRVLRWFLVPFFALVVLLITLVTFLMLRSSRRELALKSSLGRPKLKSAGAYFLGTLLANGMGCILALPVLLLVTGLGFTPLLLMIGLYLLCACGGTLLALGLLLRFDTLALLTKAD